MVMTTESEISLKELKCEIGHLTKSDGCASFLQGDTCALVSTYGPTQVKTSKENIEHAYIDVLFKPKSGLPTCVDKFLQSTICKACKPAIVTSQHPRTAINIIVQEMQNSGCLLSTTINATMLSLLDAGVPLHYTVAAVECIINEEDKIKLSPTRKEEDTARATFMFSFTSTEGNICASHAKGKFTQQEYAKCRTVCKEASRHVFEFYKESMVKKVQRTVINLNQCF